MKRSEVEKLGESLRQRKLSTQEVQDSIDRVWTDLKPQANSVPEETLRDFQSTRSVSGMRAPLWLAAAAVVVIAVGLSVAFWPRAPHATVATGTLQRVSGETTQPIQAGEQIAFGEVIRSNEKDGTFTLADGSRVEVRAQSEVSLESASDGVRIRLNHGGVIVTAAKQRSGHLYVQTPQVTVSVVGTVFLVNAEEQGSRVAVLQGEVHVQEGNTLTKLLPGEQVATALSMEPLPVAQEVSWSQNAAVHVAMLQQNTIPKVEPRLAFDTNSIKSLPPGGLFTPDMVGLFPLGFACRGVDGVRRSPFLNGGFNGELLVVPQGRCIGRGVAPYDIIAMAYGVPRRYVLGGPTWAATGTTASQGFVLEALAPDPSSTTLDQMRQMLRTLLADRFKLRFHREQQETPGFALTVGKNGLKLKEATGPEESPYPDYSVRATVTKGKTTMDELARWLTSELSTPVVNKTGLTGVYEFSFRRPLPTGGQRGDGQAPGVPPSPADRIPAFGEALEEQVGLRLESARVSFETIVIDSIEMPAPN